MTRWQLFGCTVGGLNTLASKNSILQREPKEILLVEGCGVGTRENNEMFHIYKKYQKWIHPSRYEKVAFSQSTNIPYGLVFFLLANFFCFCERIVRSCWKFKRERIGSWKSKICSMW